VDPEQSWHFHRVDNPHDAEAIEPHLAVCDPHHHLWDQKWGHYGPYGPADLVFDTTRGHKVLQTVFVECDVSYRKRGPVEFRSVGETQFAAASAERVVNLGGPPIAGIVGAVNLTRHQDLDRMIDAHEEAAQGRLRGFRLRAAWDPHDAYGFPGVGSGLLSEPTIKASVRSMAQRGLVLDLVVLFHQLLETVDLAVAAPNTKIVLDHLAYPLGVGIYADRAAEVDAEWRRKIRVVAKLPNVYMKLGGLGMWMLGGGWQEGNAPVSSDEIVDRFGSRIAFLIEEFGPERCMFESNFPVDGTAFGYVTCWNAFKKMSRQYSMADRRFLLRDTAIDVYRLPAAPEEAGKP